MKITYKLCKSLDEDLTMDMWEDVETIIDRVSYIMRVNGYGIGEMGYFFEEWEDEVIDSNTTEEEKKSINNTRRIAQNICWSLDEIDLI